MKILFTGFEPFGGDEQNASFEAVRRLPDRIKGAEILKRELPVEYDRAAELVRALVTELRPHAVVLTGQASGRPMVTPEQIAVNLEECPMADGAGVIRRRMPVDPAGPDGIFTTLPVQEIAEAMIHAGVPAAVSFSAGTYVCNSTMYSLLTFLKDRDPRIRGGFIHVPCFTGQSNNAAIPSLPLEDLTKALTAAAEVLAEQLQG